MSRPGIWMVICLVTLAGCATPTSTGGDSSGDGAQAGREAYAKVFAAVEGSSGQRRSDELVRLAEEQGGTLVWYTAMQQELAQTLADGFTAAYGIDVKLYRAGRQEVLQRVVEEASAGYGAGADVVEAPGAEMVQLSRKKLFVPYQSAIRDELIPEARFDDWTAERLNVQTVSWNTGEVSTGERPRSLRDLAHRRFDGRLALGSDDADWFATVWKHWKQQGLSDPEIERTFRDIASESFVLRGHSGRANLLAAGEYAVSASHYTHVNTGLVKKGAPISFTPVVEPAVLGPNGTALLSSGRHPAAAVLFLDWVLSDGQRAIADAGTTPTRNDLFEASDIGEVDRIVIDVEEFVDSQKPWVSRWNDLLRLGKVLEEAE